MLPYLPFFLQQQQQLPEQLCRILLHSKSFVNYTIPQEAPAGVRYLSLRSFRAVKRSAFYTLALLRLRFGVLFFLSILFVKNLLYVILNVKV